MEHVGIDLGGRKSRVCVRTAQGEILEERTVATESIAPYLAKRPPSRVILETCAEAFCVADYVKALAPVHDVRVVPSTLAPALGVGARRMKNDTRDARALSEASTRIELQSVHIKRLPAREAQSLCASREALVRARVLLINNVRGWMRQSLIRVATGATYSFPKRLREYLEKDPNGYPSFIDPMLSAVDALTSQIDALTAQVRARAQHDPICRRLMTAPIGPNTAVALMATIDSIDRFDSAHRFEAFLGLTPGENSSSERQRTTGITKAGSSRVRRLLVQCCWSMLRTKPDDPVSVWAKALAERRGKRIAIVAMARRLAGILWAMWKRQTDYDPNYIAKQKQSAPTSQDSPLPT